MNKPVLNQNKNTFVPPSILSLSGLIMLFMIVSSLLAGFGLKHCLWLTGISALLAVILLWSRTRKTQKIQCLIFSGIGFTCLGLAYSNGYQGVPFLQILSQNHLLICLLASVGFLRLITKTEAISKADNKVGFTSYLKTSVGLHLFSSVINLSAVLIFADKLIAVNQVKKTTLTTLQRFFSLACLWSPFFASMGTCLLYSPGTNISNLWMISVPLGIFGIIFTITEHRLTQSSELKEFKGYPVAFNALWIPSLMVIAVLVADQIFPNVSILTLVASISLSITFLILIFRYSIYNAVKSIIHFSKNDLPDTYGELILFFCAGVMATGLSVLITTISPQLNISQISPLNAITIMAILITLSIIGIHALISIVATSAILIPLDPDPTLMAFIYLVTWSVGATAGPISGLNLALQGRYGVKPSDCLKWNIGYALAIFSAASVIILISFD